MRLHGRKWRRGRDREAGVSSCSLSFGLSKIQRKAKIALLFGGIYGKIEILSTYNLLCRKFAAVCRNFVGNCQCLLEKLQLSALLIF